MSADISAYISLDAAPKVLERGLRGLRRRVRLVLVIRIAALGLCVLAGAAALVVVLLRLKGIWYPVLLPEAAPGIVVVGALLAALLWRLPDKTVAVSADRRLRLRDRLATALQLARGGPRPGMEEAMVTDALHHLRRARPKEAYPVRAYRCTKAAGFCVGALLLAQVLPIPPLLLSAREQEEKALLQHQATKIEPVAKKLAQEAEENRDAEARELARKLRKLAQDFRRGKVDKKKALLSLSQLQKELETLEKKVAPPALKTAHKAAEELSEAGRENIANKAEQLAERAAKRGDREAETKLKNLAKRATEAKGASELKSLAAELGEQAAKSGQELRIPSDLAAKLSEAFAGEDWDAALEALSDLKGDLEELSGELSEEEMRELAEQLEELAKILKDTDLDELVECLRKAGECLKSGDCDGAAQCLAKGVGKGKGKAAALGLGKASGDCDKCLQATADDLRGRGGSALRSSSGMGTGPDQGSQKAIPRDAEAARLFAPRTTETSGSLEKVEGQVRPQGDMFAITEQGAPLNSSDSRVPYYEVLADYSRAAEEALSREEVPLSYRSTVRDYFRALQSGTDDSGREEP